MRSDSNFPLSLRREASTENRKVVENWFDTMQFTPTHGKLNDNVLFPVAKSC